METDKGFKNISRFLQTNLTSKNKLTWKWANIVIFIFMKMSENRNFGDFVDHVPAADLCNPPPPHLPAFPSPPHTS